MTDPWEQMARTALNLSNYSAPVSSPIIMWCLAQPGGPDADMLQRGAEYAGAMSGAEVWYAHAMARRKGQKLLHRPYAAQSWELLAYSLMGAGIAVMNLKALTPDQVPGPEPDTEEDPMLDPDWDDGDEIWDWPPDEDDDYAFEEEYYSGADDLDDWGAVLCSPNPCDVPDEVWDEWAESFEDDADAARNPPDVGVGHSLHGPGFVMPEWGG